MRKEMKTLEHGGHVFEIVKSVPANYQIWNIGENMLDGYLPLCRVDENYHVIGTLKAIKIDGAQTILKAIGGGQNTIGSMERYVKRYCNSKNACTIRRVERMKEALKIMYMIKWD